MSTDPTFAVRITVREYELDSNGHVNRAVYLQYAEHARWEYLRATGVGPAELHAAGLGPVTLQETIRYLRELQRDDAVDVSCGFRWSEGKTFSIDQQLRLGDGTAAATITAVCGLLDLCTRRLIHDPAERWRALAADPATLGLPSTPAPSPAVAPTARAPDPLLHVRGGF